MTHQRGSVLLISLVILTVITLGALLALQRTNLQTRMVSNLQYQQELFNLTTNRLAHTHHLLKTNNLDDNSELKRVLYSSTAQNNAPYTLNLTPVDPNDSKLKHIDLTEEITLKRMEVKSSNHLKAHEGSDEGVPTVFRYFEHEVVSKDTAEVKSAQQLGFYYRSPVSN